MLSQHDSCALECTCPLTEVGDTIAFLEVAGLGFFIEEKILYSFTVRVTGMENITSSIYDVISKGKVASAFFFTLSRNSVFFFSFSEPGLSKDSGKVATK